MQEELSIIPSSNTRLIENETAQPEDSTEVAYRTKEPHRVLTTSFIHYDDAYPLVHAHWAVGNDPPRLDAKERVVAASVFSENLTKALLVLRGIGRPYPFARQIGRGRYVRP